MKKKIIEKLELPYDDGKGNFSSGSGEIHILRKVNEIIDVLNSWVFEPTLTIPSQSQKQPKGETIRNYNPEKRWDKYKKSKIEVREFDLVPKVQPEKQEGWRELSVNTRRILKTLGYYFSDGNEHYSCPVCGIDVVRLDQLLSERTFTKEELRLLDAYLSLALPEYNDFDKETKMHRDMDKLHKILEKISKLLKEEE